ncbi:MAG TPA: ammonia-forming cytochrome c nitrite reductase subunit c552, partial [Prolixibacteraceae bacterium]|nr:ammonia-forming cytochrome c nitrite reductase subunit c552 [Prolixibacteraceae bacterium]
MKPVSHLIENRPWLAWLIFFATIIVVFLIGLLASSIVERRAEAVFVNVPKNQISQFEPRNEVWGENFPREYQSYY